jgi:hypothetical protein
MAKKREARFIISAENKTAATISKITGDVSKMGGAFKKLGSLIGPALAGLATGAAVKGFASMIQQANDLTDSLRDSSIRLGIGIADLQAYQLAAGNAGIEAGALTGILGKLNKAAGEIKLGTGSDKTIEAFSAIGVSVEEIQQSNPAELFEKVIEGLGGISDPAARAALAMQVFGKSGQTALTLVADGAGSLRESRGLLDELGLSLSQIDGDNVDRANDAIGTLSFVAEAAKQKIGAELAPTIASLSEQLLAAGNEGQSLGVKIETGVRATFLALDTLGAGISLVTNSFQGMFNLLQAGWAAQSAFVLGFASDFVAAIGTTGPNAFNKLLEATETGLTAMKQGFADLATTVANSFVAAINSAIGAIELLVNTTANGINAIILAANGIAGTSFGTIPTASFGRASGFDRFPVDRVDLGRVSTFGQGAADTLGSYSEGMGIEAKAQLDQAGQAFRELGLAYSQIAEGEGGALTASLDKANSAAKKLNEVLDPPGSGSGGSGGGSGGGKGGTTGALNKVGEAGKEAGDAITKTFKIVEEYGKAVTSSLERGIDEFVKNGKLSLSDFGASVLQDLAAITAKAAILGGILGNSQYGGNGSGGLIGSLIYAAAGGSTTVGAPKAIPVGSYAGGGFTGMGSRSGGVDGKGGFPAILHPNETVLDHTKGQGMGGGTTVNQTIMVRETLPSGIAAQIAKQASQQAQAALKQISDRGGNRRRSFRFA